MTGGDLHPAWAGQLREGLSRLDLPLGPDRQQRLLTFLGLLRRWNRAFNLTAIRDPEQMVSRQLLDSLSILPLMAGPRVLDVGTGPGFPGIPLAIARPAYAFTLLDSNGKKTRFVRQAVMELGLPNVEVVQERSESWRPDAPFDTVTARAFAPLPRLLTLVGHLVADTGRVVAMTGVCPEQEIAQIEARGLQAACRRLVVPGCAGERHAILVTAPSGWDAG